MKNNLLLLHGALGSKNQFASIRSELEVLCNVYDMNFDGHGDLFTEKEFSIDLFTNNVIDFLSTKALNSVSIFGYSMGGYVGLNTSLKIPTKINKIITLGTKFNWSIESAKNEVMMLNPDIIEKKVPKFAETLAKEHLPQDWKLVVRKTAKMMTKMGEGAKIQDTDFTNLDLPVIIGLGSLDKMVSYEESENIASLIPNSKIVRLEGVKHPISSIEDKVLLNYIVSNLT